MLIWVICCNHDETEWTMVTEDRVDSEKDLDGLPMTSILSFKAVDYMDARSLYDAFWAAL